MPATSETAGLRKPGPFERVGAAITADEGAKLEHVRARFEDLHDFVKTLPEGRERALALTDLEQAGMWATKAVTHVPRAMPEPA